MEKEEEWGEEGRRKVNEFYDVIRVCVLNDSRIFLLGYIFWLFFLIVLF